jgi:predicted deacylase
VVGKCEVGIDLHTAADRRANLPQIRGDLEDPRTRELAAAFGAPVMLHARLRDGSLRQAARDVGATVLLYEAGEAMRFDEHPISVGVLGVRRVLAELGMVDPPDEATGSPTQSVVSHSSGWVRARGTGILHLEVKLGEHVEDGRRLGGLSDTFGRRVRLVHADRSGVVIGLTRAPMVHAGDALVHIAEVDETIDVG